MMDFRFHVVSLAAVFVALAVGVVLGSGPMRTALVGEISDEVERLEQELAQAEVEVQTAREQSVVGEEFVDQAAPLIIGDTLTDARVAVVLVADPAQENVDAQRDLVVQAGGTVVATADLSDAWTDSGQTAFRSALADQIVGNVVGVDDSQPADQILAHALAQALIPELALGDVPEEDLEIEVGLPDADSATDRAAVLTDLLSEADLLDATVTAPADAVVFLVGAGPQDGDGDDDLARQSSVYAQVASTMAEYGSAVVVAGGGPTAPDVPTAVRNVPEAAGEVSTVMHATSHYGRYATVLALAQQRAGGQGHYGPGEGVRFVP